MITFFIVFILATSVPFGAWRRYHNAWALFAGAAIVMTLYSAAMVLIHGLSTTYEFDGSTVTLAHWPWLVNLLAHYIIATIVLLAMARWHLSPNQKIMAIVFWCFNIAMLASIGVQHIFQGYQYPPIWYETLTSEQVGMLNLARYFTNLVYTLSKWAFLGLVTLKLLPALPSAAKKLVTAIRSL